MKLKKNVELSSFLKAARGCRGDVLFVTEDGDKLNLKSILSQYVFSAVSGQPDIIESGEIQLQAEEDYERLEAFLLLSTPCRAPRCTASESIK